MKTWVKIVMLLLALLAVFIGLGSGVGTVELLILLALTGVAIYFIVRTHKPSTRGPVR